MINKAKAININTILANKWFKAKVIKGKGRGKKLGFPTINLKTPATSIQKSVFEKGAYICKLKFLEPLNLKTNNSNKVYFGLLHYGSRSTFKETKAQLEIYILNFNQEVKIGEIVEFKLIKYLRQTKKFSHSKMLVKQIKQDVKKAKKLINKKMSKN